MGKLKYKKFGYGSTLDYSRPTGADYANAGATGLQLASGIVDASQADNIDSNGLKRPSMGGSILKGAASGAAAGSVAGPWGTVIGGVVGAAAGIFSGKSAQNKYNKLSSAYNIRNNQMFDAQTRSRIAMDPSLVAGNQNASYFADGGRLQNSYQPQVGAAKQLSSTATDFKGPSHEQGGIDLPAQQAQVEGDETVDGGYVFSDRLGFAKLHRPIAASIGKIEKKAMAPERLQSLGLLRTKEAQLKQSQEMVKQAMGLT